MPILFQPNTSENSAYILSLLVEVNWRAILLLLPVYKEARQPTPLLLTSEVVSEKAKDGKSPDFHTAHL